MLTVNETLESETETRPRRSKKVSRPSRDRDVETETTSLIESFCKQTYQTTVLLYSESQEQQTPIIIDCRPKYGKVPVYVRVET